MNEAVLVPEQKPPGFSVLVLDMYHYMDPEEEETVAGFATIELAREYAKRRTRDSLEQQRPGNTTPQAIRSSWFMFGEDCLVIGGSYSGCDELDYFISHPATDEERDWVSLTPDPELRRLLQSVADIRPNQSTKDESERNA